MSDFDVSPPGRSYDSLEPEPTFEHLLEGSRAPETEDEMDVVALTTALCGPARPDELASLDSDVAAFGIARRAALAAATTVAPVDLRRNSRPVALASVAVAGVAASVLFVGTAAAALTGSLPAPLQRVAHNLAGAPAPAADASTPAAIGPSAGATDPATVGLCRAFRDWPSASPSSGSTAQAALAAAAAAEGRSVAEFCARVLAPTAVTTVVPGPPASASPPGTSGTPAGPPGQNVRPTVPPGQEKKPTAPPGKARKPTAPPGQARKPTVPPGETKKPPTPPGATKKPATPPGQSVRLSTHR